MSQYITACAVAFADAPFETLGNLEDGVAVASGHRPARLVQIGGIAAHPCLVAGVDLAREFPRESGVRSLSTTTIGTSFTSSGL